MDRKVVIIPTYNEKENIEAIVRKVFSLEGEYNVLIIDDGSPDGTAAIVKKVQTEFPERLFLIERSGKLGLGTAYLTGFKWALENGYDYIFEMDADFSHNPEDLPRLYKACAECGGVAIGSRYCDGIKCYSRKALETIDLDDVRMKGYGFQIEMKYTAWKLGFELAEVPIIFVNRKLGTSKMSGGIFGEAFWGVIRLKFRKFHRKG